MDADGLVDAIAEAVSDLEILGREPAADAFVLQVRVEPVRELLVV